MDIICRQKRLEILRGGATMRRTDIVPHPVLTGTGMFSQKAAQTEFGENRAISYLLQNVIEAIFESKPLAMSAEEALDTIRICEQVREKAGTLRGTVCQT